jgi:diguanylate cyclase (GGDEF)-like protein
MSPRRNVADAKPAREKKPGSRRPKAAAPAEPFSDLLEVVLAVTQRLEIEGQVHALLDIARDWTAADDGLALARDAEGTGMALVTGTLPPADPRLEAVVAAVRARGQASWADGAFPLDAEGVRAVAVPLRGDPETVVAAVVVLEPRKDAAAELTELAHRLRPAVANAMLVRAIRELTIRDDTASCFNRRYFEEFVVEELARANRFKAPMSLIFFDMDNLKEVNTRLGHAAGSRTLYEVSDRVRGKIRKFDKLFRFGGDEFCIVLPETEWHGALEVAERVRDAIAGKPFLIAQGGGAAGNPMTASFGVASFPLHARTKEELVQRADRAMQSIKASVKNAIAVAERNRDHDGA